VEQKKSQPIAYTAYQKLAQSYADLAPTKDYNAYYDRPATISLLDEIAGHTVLDAGCGPGIYTEILIQRQATVTALDVSENMLEYAKQRNGDQARYFLADLESPLHFLQRDEFDGILSALTVSYVRDLKILFKEFGRILKPGGWFVFSTEHPFFGYTYFGLENYFITQAVSGTWTSFDQKMDMPSYFHSLTYITDSLLENGFEIEKILEPLPTKDFKKVNPNGYAKRMNFPSFIHFKARKKNHQKAFG
jgi:SAM-dependent methyltransferase